MRLKKGHAGPIARDHNIGIAAIEEFVYGKGKLTDATMTAMAKEIFGDNCSFDAERNLLVRTLQPSTVVPRLGMRATPRQSAHGADVVAAVQVGQAPAGAAEGPRRLGGRLGLCARWPLCLGYNHRRSGLGRHPATLANAQCGISLRPNRLRAWCLRFDW